MPLHPLSWIVTSCSEDVASLAANVANVVERGVLSHGLPISDTLPDACCHVLAILHGVLLHLFDVGFFRRAVSATDALVMACVQRITSLKWPKERLRFQVLLLLWESNVCTVSCEVGVEGAALADRVRPGLLAVDDQAILLGVLVTALILLTLPRVLRVSHLVLVGERLCLNTSLKSRSTLRHGAFGRSQWDVLKLRRLNLLVRTGQEWLLLLGGRSLATETAIVLAWVLVGVTERVALEISKGRLLILTAIDSHSAVEAYFIALLAVRLIVGAGVSHGQTHGHGEERITLPT